MSVSEFFACCFAIFFPGVKKEEFGKGCYTDRMMMVIDDDDDDDDDDDSLDFC